MSEIQDDAKIVDDRKPIQDTDVQKVTVSLREQISERLMKKLEEMNIGQKVDNMWSQGMSDRTKWLERQEEYLLEVDEFIDPIYDSATDWGSTLHLPVIFTVCKTFHARMFAALMSIDPPFTMRSRSAANVDRARSLQELMRYTISDWANENQGVQDDVDAWLWDWITAGQGILKARWHRQFTRFEDVEETLVPRVVLVTDPESGQLVQSMSLETEEKLVSRMEKVYEGPCLEYTPFEDVLIIGGKGNVNKADAVLHRQRLTASDLFTLADQGVFDSDKVDKVVKGGNSSESKDASDAVKVQRQLNAGETGLDKNYDLDRYEIIEAYIRCDVDGSGINSDLIVWVHPQTKSILRATYLRRAMKTGLRPFFKIGFHKRYGADNDVGMVELLYSLGKEIDAMHNMKIDTGILTSLPWGFYRPTNAFNAEKMPISPGDLIPTSDPQRDVFFPNLGNRTSFGVQEEAALMNQIERLTSINDMSFGMLSGQQGVTRTATGADLLAGETSSNLNIYIQRMNRGWKQALKYVFHLLQQKMPDGLEYRITGEDGNDYFKTVRNKQELEGMYDFELEPNSANSNPRLQQQRAQQIYQITQNPIDLQLGLVSPLERYEAIRGVLVSIGIKDVSRYIRKPAQMLRVFTPLEIANRILSGIDVPLDPTQDLQGFISFVQGILEEDELLGQFGQSDVAALVAKMQEAQGLMQALQQAQNDQMVLRQQGINSSALFGGGLQGRVESDSSQGVGI